MAISAELGEALEQAVNDLVATGRYHSKSEVLREGVRLVQEREARFHELEAQLRVGQEDVDAGRVHPADEAFDRIRSRIKNESAKKAS